MHNIGFKATVYRWYIRGWGCIEEGRVPHYVCVSFEPESESNTLMKFNLN